MNATFTPSSRHMNFTLRCLTLVGLSAIAAMAQDGGQIFATYCAACHGQNGEGALNGQFPPLAGSPWVAGNSDRATKIVLSGLHGPVEINGKKWDLDMPPQGAALPDDQIAAVLTYVRRSWGNQASAVTEAQVKTVRAATASRSGPWTAAELLKQHPLEIKPPIEDLLSSVYDGSWKSLPDFSTLKPVATEEEHAGLISLAKTGRKDNFGVVWEGKLTLPVDAEYEFYFAVDDGGRLLLDGQEVVKVDGIGPVQGRGKIGKQTFKAGAHPIRVEYYEFTGQEEIQVAWRKKGEKQWHWLSDKTPAESSRPSLMLEPAEGRAAIYRNFIQGTSARGIGIGLPGGVNFAYSADRLAPELIWKGEFIDAARHWTERGQGAQAPAGDHVVKLTNEAAYDKSAKFLGYKLDKAGNPTFSVQVGQNGETRVLDAYQAGSPGGTALERTLSVVGKGSPVSILISSQAAVTATSPKEITLGNAVVVKSSTAAFVIKDGNKCTLSLTPGQTTTLTYLWK